MFDIEMNDKKQHLATLFPYIAPLSGFRGIWRMWPPLKV